MHQTNFTLKILIVEDDFSFALDLQMLVEDMGYHVIAVVESAEKALEVIKKKEPDAILMDIDLKGRMTGLELANKIQKKQIPILFITSYKDQSTYQEAKKLKMIGFLVKPLNDLTLMSAIDACLRELPKASKDNSLNILNDSLFIKKGKLYHKVKLKDIRYMESDKEYVTIHTASDKFVMRESLKNLTEVLDGFAFFRSHQSYIINLEYLQSINMDDSVAIMDNGHHVPISRRNRKIIEENWSRTAY